MAGDVSALVVTYNHADEIEPCIRAAAAQCDEVVVIDNASSDGTADVVAGMGGPIRLIRSPDNLGFAEGVNRAFAESTGRHILLLNPDCVLEEGCVDALRAHLEADPLVGAAAAMLHEEDGSPQLFARRDITLPLVFWNFTEVGRRLDERLTGGRRAQDRRYADRFPPAEPLAVDVPAAACVLVARSHLEPRPMDPALPLFFNDAEMFRRLRARGLRAEIVPAATAAHGYGTSHRRLDADRRHAEFVASMWRYVRPYPLATRVLMWLLLVLDALFALVLVKAGRGRSTTGPLARGTLGGLGLPGGATPWISRPRGVLAGSRAPRG